MIRISSLPLIENSEQFHQSKLILLVDVLLVGNAPRNMREHIKTSYGGFTFEKETYIPITLTGTPESLLANAWKPIQFKFDKGFENNYHFDGNLQAAFHHKILYDLSDYAGSPNIAFDREETFIIQRYITERTPYQEPQNLLTMPSNNAAIGLKTMKGLKPVKKS